MSDRWRAVRAQFRPVRRRLAWCAGGVAVLASAGAVAAGSAAAAQSSYSGTLPDGATWIADLPPAGTAWNGTLLLYSHGYGPLVAADAPSAAARQELLNEGYALAGSSYDPHGPWWALGSAPRDQFETLSLVENTVLPSSPTHVYAVGTSMGGLISALEDQDSNGRLDGALTTCGIVAGANNLNQYQLDGEYALSQLLLPGQNVQLTNFTDSPPAGPDSAATANALIAAGSAAQNTAQGRARLALAMAFLNVSPWGATATPPAPPSSTIPSLYDYPGQETGQFDDYFTGGFPALAFVVEGRNQIEAAAGGEGSGTAGVDFARLLHQSSYYPEVRALYNEAGLSLRADLATLRQNANLRPNRTAFRWLAETSVPTGHLQVPELDLHTISDQLVPVQQEAWYHALVARAGDTALLRQAFTLSQGHCNFTTADIVAGLHALEARVTTGSWGDVATANALDAAANSMPASLGGGNFVPFWPNRLTGGLPVLASEAFRDGPRSWRRPHRHVAQPRSRAHA